MKNIIFFSLCIIINLSAADVSSRVSIDKKIVSKILDKAIDENNGALIGQFIQGGLDVDMPIFGYGTPLLIRAATKGKADIVAMLIEKCKANIDIQDKMGWTALRYAACEEFMETVEVLLARGKANPNIKDVFGTTLLTSVRWSNPNKKLISQLISAGARYIMSPDQREADHTGLFSRYLARN